MQACVRVAGSKGDTHWRGSVHKRKGRDLCACKKRGGTREISSVCVCVYIHKVLGFSSLLSPQASPKNQSPKEPFSKT